MSARPPESKSLDRSEMLKEKAAVGSSQALDRLWLFQATLRKLSRAAHIVHEFVILIILQPVGICLNLNSSSFFTHLMEYGITPGLLIGKVTTMHNKNEQFPSHFPPSTNLARDPGRYERAVLRAD